MGTDGSLAGVWKGFEPSSVMHFQTPDQRAAYPVIFPAVFLTQFPKEIGGLERLTLITR